MSVNNDNQEVREVIDLAAIRKERHQRKKRRRESMEQEPDLSRPIMSRPSPHISEPEDVEFVDMEGRESEPKLSSEQIKAMNSAVDKISQAKELLNSAQCLLLDKNVGDSETQTHFSNAHRDLSSLQGKLNRNLNGNKKKPIPVHLEEPKNETEMVSEEDDFNLAFNLQNKYFEEERAEEQNRHDEEIARQLQLQFEQQRKQQEEAEANRRQEELQRQREERRRGERERMVAEMQRQHEQQLMNLINSGDGFMSISGNQGTDPFAAMGASFSFSNLGRNFRLSRGSMGDNEIFNHFGGHRGYNHPGADADEINNNTSVEQFVPRNVQNEDKNNSKKEEQQKESCCICMEDFKAGDDIRRLPCLHIFHKGEVDNWLSRNSTCPICKTPIQQN